MARKPKKTKAKKPRNPKAATRAKRATPAKPKVGAKAVRATSAVPAPKKKSAVGDTKRFLIQPCGGMESGSVFVKEAKGTIRKATEAEINWAADNAAGFRKVLRECRSNMSK